MILPIASRACTEEVNRHVESWHLKVVVKNTFIDVESAVEEVPRQGLQTCMARFSVDSFFLDLDDAKAEALSEKETDVGSERSVDSGEVSTPSTNGDLEAPSKNKVLLPEEREEKRKKWVKDTVKDTEGLRPRNEGWHHYLNELGQTEWFQRPLEVPQPPNPYDRAVNKRPWEEKCHMYREELRKYFEVDMLAHVGKKGKKTKSAQ